MHADNLISATLALGGEASLSMRGNPSPLNSGERNHTVAAPQVSTAADVLHIPKRNGLPGSEAWATGRYGTKGVSAASEQGPGLSLSLITMAA